MKIEFATVQDAPALADIFFSHLAAHPEYISHGEMQMGVGEGVIRDGVLVAQTAPDGREKWMKYIQLHLENEELARVWKAVSDQGEIVGFVVADIEDDGDAPFGMVCDVLVKEACRGCGAGEALLQTAIAWLRLPGVRQKQPRRPPLLRKARLHPHLGNLQARVSAYSLLKEYLRMGSLVWSASFMALVERTFWRVREYWAVTVSFTWS